MKNVRDIVADIILGIFGTIVAGIIGVSLIGVSIVAIIHSFLPAFCISHPLFGGVIISWFFAFISTVIILICALINRKRKVQYEIILNKSKRLLMFVSMAVLFYISINFASEALTGKGVPIFSDPSKIGPFSPVSPQDIFLIFLVFMIIFLVFLIAPRCKLSGLSNPILIIILIIITFIIILIVYPLFKYYAETLPESPPNKIPEQILSFGIFGSILFIVSILIWKSLLPKEAKTSDSFDLYIYFSVIPAIIVASLVLIRNPLVTYPNFAGHAVVGFLFISGFATLVILTRISLEDLKTAFWTWGFAIVLSLSLISLFSGLFLLFEPYFYSIDELKKILMFSIAIILLILQYGFSYEKLFKSGFTEWWRRSMRSWAMVISILLILVIGAVSPEIKLWGLPAKLIMIFIALVLVLFLPWILHFLKFWKDVKFKGFKLQSILHSIPLPEYQGMVLVKVEIGQDKLRKVVNKLDHIEGVYQTMVVMGEYDVCLIVEGEDYYKTVKKIIEIRNIEGVASTTTLTDIREFFDKRGNEIERSLCSNKN